MRLVLLGVRGSTPAPGAEFIRYGGHTSCVAVLPDGVDTPPLVLDAGTGLRNLGRLLDGGPFRGTLAATHLHWDHVQGIPFSRAVDHPWAEVTMLLPAPSDAEAMALLSRQMSPPSFPITPAGLQGHWRFVGMQAGGGHEVAGLRLTWASVAHKGGVTMGLRVDDGTRSLAYLPDHDASVPVADGTLELVRGADLLLHDAQFTADESDIARAYGHSTIDEAVALAAAADVGELVLFHHGPGRTDEALDRIAEQVKDAPLPVRVGAEGDVVVVASAGPALVRE